MIEVEREHHNNVQLYKVTLHTIYLTGNACLDSGNAIRWHLAPVYLLIYLGHVTKLPFLYYNNYSEHKSHYEIYKDSL